MCVGVGSEEQGRGPQDRGVEECSSFLPLWAPLIWGDTQSLACHAQRKNGSHLSTNCTREARRASGASRSLGTKWRHKHKA